MQLDLNLLIALDALLKEGSVTGAATRLHVSTPAMSRTLGRIRRATGDQILVRTGRTMTPTPRAVAMQDEVRDLVRRASEALRPEHELDLATLDRVFTVRGHDAATTAVGPVLLAALQLHAPRVALRMLAEPATDTSDLRQGRIDLDLGSEQPGLPEIESELLGYDRLVLAMRHDHALAGRRLTLQRLTQSGHILVSRRGRLRDPLDTALAERGCTRHTVSSAPTSAAALAFVAHSDLLVVVPERMCRDLIERLGLRTKPLPLELPDVPLYLSWHQRSHGDLAHGWLRDQVREAFGGIFRG
jgi:DNA-binding transcriptional LysR family regulator